MEDTCFMDTLINDILSANKRYADCFGKKSELPLPPGRHLAILTCMDARLDPAKFAGLEEGDAHVVRNAGGRATDDAIRSLVISHKLLGTRTWLVIHHTDCGMETFTDQVMAALLEESLETAELGAQGWQNASEGRGSIEGHFRRWHTIDVDDPARSVIEDVKRIRHHPLVSRSVAIAGYLFDVRTGLLNEVPEASQAGLAGEEPRI